MLPILGQDDIKNKQQMNIQGSEAKLLSMEA